MRDVKGVSLVPLSSNDRTVILELFKLNLCVSNPKSFFE